MNLRNYTPHPLDIHFTNAAGEERVLIVPSRGDVRVTEVREPRGVLEDGIQLSAVSYGEITGLPADLQPGDALIVSLLCVPALRGRLPEGVTLLSPGPLVRDPQGRPVGCEGLTVWG